MYFKVRGIIASKHGILSADIFDSRMYLPSLDAYAQYPEFADIPILVAVNCEYVSPESEPRAISIADEVALIPPLAGG